MKGDKSRNWNLCNKEKTLLLKNKIKTDMPIQTHIHTISYSFVILRLKTCVFTRKMSSR